MNFTGIALLQAETSGPLDIFAGIPSVVRMTAKSWYGHPCEFLGSPKRGSLWLEDCTRRVNISVVAFHSSTNSS
jgi:hypothetical protein